MEPDYSQLTPDYDYPSDDALNAIRTWNGDWRALMEFVRGIWFIPENATECWENHYRLITAGWSGNESIIDALKGNPMFWSTCWLASHRVGLYFFKVPQ